MRMANNKDMICGIMKRLILFVLLNIIKEHFIIEMVIINDNDLFYCTSNSHDTMHNIEANKFTR